MQKILVKFKDEDLGNELVTFTYDDKHNFTDKMNLAKSILYLDFDCSTYKELKEECPKLTKKLYNIAMEILMGGDAGVTASRFCEFMQAAFGWQYEFIKADVSFDVYYGNWD